MKLFKLLQTVWLLSLLSTMSTYKSWMLPFKSGTPHHKYSFASKDGVKTLIQAAESLNFQIMRSPQVFVVIQRKTLTMFSNLPVNWKYLKNIRLREQLAQPTWNTFLSHPDRKRKGYEATHKETRSRITWNHTFRQSQHRLLQSCFWSVLWNVCSAHRTYSTEL